MPSPMKRNIRGEIRDSDQRISTLGIAFEVSRLTDVMIWGIIFNSNEDTKFGFIKQISLMFVLHRCRDTSI